MRQHATVYWEQIRQDKYRRLCPSATSAENERTRHVNRSRSLMAIIDQLVTEFPQVCNGHIFSIYDISVPFTSDK